MLYLHMQDVVANAIIELNQMNGSRRVSMEQTKRYGKELIYYFRNLGYHTNIKSSTEAISYFEKKYADFFTKYQINGEFGYSLQEDKTIIDLVDNFRNSLESEALLAFTSPSVTKVLQSKSIGDNFNQSQNSCSQFPIAKLLSSNHTIKEIYSPEKHARVDDEHGFIEKVVPEDRERVTLVRERTIKKTLH